jgi:hypothetical protein
MILQTIENNNYSCGIYIVLGFIFDLRKVQIIGEDYAGSMQILCISSKELEHLQILASVTGLAANSPGQPRTTIFVLLSSANS